MRISLRALTVLCAVGFALATALWIGVAQTPKATSSQPARAVGTSLGVRDGLSLAAAAPANTLSSSPFARELRSLHQPQQPSQVTARRAGPAAVAARRASRTRFARLDASQAVSADAKALPELIDRASGGPPALPAGQRIVGYLSGTVAQVALGGRRRAVIESLAPMAVETAPRHYSPVDLGMTQAANTFRPIRPAVGVSIPKRLSDGVELPAPNLSMIPVGARGAPLAGSEGAIDGAGVIYANTQTDADTFVKPTTGGFEVNTLLRSPASPEDLYFRLRLPEGAKLVQSTAGAGKVGVMLQGRQIALVPPPSARDAAGSPVPVAMALEGDLLHLSVAARGGAFQWPIAVDPEAIDTHTKGELESDHPHSNWLFARDEQAVRDGTIFAQERGEQWLIGKAWSNYSPGDGYVFEYATRGASRVYKLEAKVTTWDVHGRATLVFVRAPNPEYGAGVESELLLAEHANRPEHSNSERYPVSFCVASGCSTWGYQPNSIALEQIALDPGTGGEGQYNELFGELYEPHVYIEQEAQPEISFSGAEWLGPYSQPIKVKVHDPGIGLTYVSASKGNPPFSGEVLKEQHPYKEGKCAGIQCVQTWEYSLPYKPGWYPPGWYEGTPLTVKAENATGVLVEREHMVKVDLNAPEIALSGLPASGEIGASPHTLVAEANDHQSGVASVAVSIDGGSPTALSGSCAGNCKVKAEYDLKGESLSEGVHRLTVLATDNAGNVGSKKFTFDVRHVSPVAIGPGSVDPTTGQYTLSATDVSLSGVDGVTRTYQSRNLSAGASGPLGPQWAIGFGGAQGLTVLPDGSVVLTSPAGATTTFLREASGEYRSPKGDENLKFEATQAGNAISEYVLSDTTAGTTTRFTQPAGAEKTAPVVRSEFGSEGAMLAHPVSDAVDASGNVWVTDYGNNRIEKFSSTGTLLAAYGAEGHDGGQFKAPWGIALDNAGNAYVTDQGNNRIEELSSSGTFVRAFGWGVSDGKAQFEICTNAASCQPGIAGAGGGQVSTEAGVAIDASGNVWVADLGNNRIEEFNGQGSFLVAFGWGVTDGGNYPERCTTAGCRAGLAGSGSGQFNVPLNIAFSSKSFSGKYPFVTDSANNRVQEITTETGYSVLQIKGGSASPLSGPYGIAADPRSGDLYVTDLHNSRVEQFSAEGKLIARFGTAGTGTGQFDQPTGVAVSEAGGVYVVDYATSRVALWERATWLPMIAQGPLASATTTYAYQTQEVEEGNTVIEPIEALAPVPAGVTCTSKLSEPSERGCRALTFEYAQGTYAYNGEIKGHLMRVYFNAWDPAAGKMVKQAVARYEYDSQGRLSAEWDPRVEASSDCAGACSALKTTYGYDLEGHVTAMSPPGQQPWLFSYGTSEGDPAAGRLLSVTRPAAKTSFNQNEPRGESRPALSPATPLVGQAATVSNGTWAHSPLSFSYQWVSCDGAGNNCEAIPGAVNQTYTPLARDRGRRLTAEVTATNAAGSFTCGQLRKVGGYYCEAKLSEPVSGSSELSQEPLPAPPAVGSNSVWTLEYNIPASGAGATVPSGNRPPPTLSTGEVAKWGQTKDLPTEGMAMFPPDEPMGWPANDYKRATIGYWDEHGRVVNTAVPGGAISTREYNATNEVERALSADNRAAALAHGSESAAQSLLLDTKSEYTPDGSELTNTRGPQHKVRLASGAEPLARNHVHYYYDEEAPPGSAPHLVTKTTDAAEYEGKEADARTTKTYYSGVAGRPGQTDIGWRLRKPTSVTNDAGPGGRHLTTSTIYDPATGNAVETITPAGGKSQGAPGYNTAFGKGGTGAGEMSNPRALTLDDEGNVWVADTANNRVDEFERSGGFIKMFGWGVKANAKPKSEVCYRGEVCQAGIESNKKGALNRPEGIAYDPLNGTLYVSDTHNNRVEEFALDGHPVRRFGKPGAGSGQLSTPLGLTVDPQGDIWVADGANSRLEKFTERGKKPAAYGRPGKGEGEFSGVGDVTYCAGKLYATDTGGQRVEEFSTSGSQAGQLGTESGRFTQVARIACDATGNNLYVTDSGANRVDIFSSSGAFVGSFPSTGGQLSAPTGVAVGASGEAYVLDSNNNRVTLWQPQSAVHNGQTIYYTKAPQAPPNSECGEHAEWANLPCRTQPALEPSNGPSLPVSTLTYNVWDELETTSESFPASGAYPATTRAKKSTFDPAGRGLTSEESANPSTATALPPVTDSYSPTSGELETQSASTGKTITSKYNTLGQLVSYTDADSSTPTTYHYEEEGDARLTKVEDVKGSQTYEYDSTTGEMTKLTDSGAKTFEASYDEEGKLTSEHYPNGLTASYTIDAVGQATSLAYTKTTSCGESCTWFSESIAPSIHGETLTQASTLAKNAYTYDPLGRLEETQETTAKGCTTRSYAYDEESNRTALTTYPGSGSKCEKGSGTSETHSYDAANRLADSGVKYETLGNTSALPALDAGGHELKSEYYVDGQVASQTQYTEKAKGNETIRYGYDPLGRARETTAEPEGKAKTTAISHYPGAGEAVSWTSEGAAWTRNIPGIDGSLSAIQTATETTLQLHDLKGNIVATAGLSESETKLRSTYNSTEFGVPNEGKAPPKYAWLGAVGVATELSSGVATKAGASYVPQIARNLQTEPVTVPLPPNNGVAESYTAHISGWSLELLDSESAAVIAEYAARQAALAKKAEEAILESTGDPEYLLDAHGLNSFAEALEDKPDELEKEGQTDLMEPEGCATDLQCRQVSTPLKIYGARVQAAGAQLRYSGFVTNWSGFFRSKAAHIEKSWASGHLTGMYLVKEEFRTISYAFGLPPSVNIPTNYEVWYCSYDGYSAGQTAFNCGSKGIRRLNGRYG